MFHLLALNTSRLFNTRRCKVCQILIERIVLIKLLRSASGQISQIFTGKDWNSNTAAATPVLGSHVVHQSRRLYVGNIPFGVSEVRK